VANGIVPVLLLAGCYEWCVAIPCPFFDNLFQFLDEFGASASSWLGTTRASAILNE
jgi:hypothetical protein